MVRLTLATHSIAKKTPYTAEGKMLLTVKFDELKSGAAQVRGRFK
jgi:hypothetical protein